MDAVIAFVNGDDPLWIADYEQFSGPNIHAKRFRDWGTLKFIFRGIETNMPFVDRIFLAVSRESQVPEWVNRDKVNVVLHKDFIPEEYLPAFNSCLIEMFLYRIPGLGEKFIYFNDDVFPVRPVQEKDLFPKGKPAKQMSLHFGAVGDFKQQCKNSCDVARKAAGLPPRPYFYRPQHSVTPLLKSACEEAYNAGESFIKPTLTQLRSHVNINQYYYSDYMFLKKMAISRRISHKHFSMSISAADDIVRWLQKPRRDFVCINDVEMPRMRFLFSRERLIDGFTYLYPAKSEYEL